MSIRHLRLLFAPTAIALIGASERPGSLGEALTRNLLAGGFKGAFFLVNRRHRTVRELPAYGRLADLPRVPELAIIATPVRTIPRLLIEAGRCGIKAVMIATPYRTDRDDETAVIRQAVRKVARAYGLRVLGPGGGLLWPPNGLNVSLSHRTPLVGRLSLVSQSQGPLSPLLEWASTQGVGFSHIVVMAGSSDVTIAEVLDWLANDADTDIILLVLETVDDARSLLSAARAAARVKPVLAVRPGQSHDWHDSAFRQTDAIYDAAWRRAGVLRLPSLQALFQTAFLLTFAMPIVGDRLAIVGASRMLNLLATDLLLAEGGRLARFGQQTTAALQRLLSAEVRPDNPLDLGNQADADDFAAALAAILPGNDADGVLVLQAPNAWIPSAEVATAVIAAINRCWTARGERQPGVILCWPGAQQQCITASNQSLWRIPAYDAPEQAIEAFMHCWRREQNRAHLTATPPWLQEPTEPERLVARQCVTQALAAGRDRLDRAEIATLLGAYAIAFSPSTAGPMTGLLTMTLRMTEDLCFGPVLLLELDDPMLPLAGQPIAILPPLDLTLARAAIGHSPFYRWLRDAKTIAPGVLERFLSLLVRVARLVVDLAEIVEMEWSLAVTPASAADVTVTSASIRLAVPEEPGHARLAIRPYPRELEEYYPLPDGSTLLIRPVRAEDEPTFIDAFAQLSTEEVRMRFLYTFKELSHEEAVRLTRIDYAREMALVVFRQRPGQTMLERCGVGRLMRDVDDERAEFAIILLRAATGIGLGSLLVRRLIRYARACGFREVFGEVLRENESMLALCRAMGFIIEACPEDAGVMIVRLLLTDTSSLRNEYGSIEV